MVDGSSSILNAVHDSASPYFISPSENPGNTLVTSLLKGPNYPVWRRSIITALRAKRKIRFVDGILARPIDGSRDHFLWDTCNSMVMSWIYNSVVPEIYDSISFFESARDIWVDLEERYSQGNAPRIHELKTQIWSFRQGNDMTIATYYAHLRGLWEELMAYSKVPTCSCGATREIQVEKEEERLHQFLFGLKDSYDTLRDQLLSMEPLPTVNKAYALLIRGEKQKEVTAVRTSQPEAAALAVKPMIERANKEIGSKERNKKYFRCDHCKKTGHTRDRCFELIGYPPGWQSKDRVKDRGNGAETDSQHQGGVAVNATTSLNTDRISPIPDLSPTQYQQLIFLLGQDKTQSAVNFVGKASLDSFHHSWILDSGASEHLTFCKSFLHDIESLDNALPVTLPNGVNMSVHSYGDVTLTNDITLHRTLYAPNFTCNLVSVSKLARELNCAVLFFPTFCALQDLATRKLIGLGELQDGLYYFKGLAIRPARTNKVNDEDSFIAILVYVDDMIITGNNPLKCQETGMIGIKPTKFPMQQHLKLTVDDGKLLDDPGPYRRLLGRLIYLTITRPDIAYSVHVLTQFMQSPRQPHLDAAFRILRYLKGSPGQGIFFSSVNTFQLYAYCDADWAGCPMTRRSTTGFYVSLGDAPISWRAKKQTTVSRSSAKAEYRAMAHTISELLWLRALLSDLSISHHGPMFLYCDNQAALHIAANLVFHERTKHIEIDCHFVRERLQSQDIATRYVPTHC
ncbi:uncharacterized protein [Elaeis guineensis]|uniref:uncharacterized protein n=1 Tax=Elaeis guineensis var. tenera TaxID=51953 RepID=UPI003C6D060C